MPLESRLDAGGELVERQRYVGAPVEHEVLLAAAAFDDEIEPARERDVVADLGVPVERQVKSVKVQIVLEELRDAAPLRADQTLILAAPEVPVVHEDRVRPGFDRTLDQRQ